MTRTFALTSAIVCLLATLVSSGCAGSSSSRRGLSAEERALRTGNRKIRRSLERAYRRSESRAPYTIRARYNPCRCDGPAFELFAHGKWTRAYLEVGTEQRQKIESLKTDESIVDTGSPPEFRGEWSGRREAETGLSYPVFSVQSVEQSEG